MKCQKRNNQLHQKSSLQKTNLAFSKVADADFPIAPNPTPTASPSGREREREGEGEGETEGERGGGTVISQLEAGSIIK